jgi:hypothetical protein
VATVVQLPYPVADTRLARHCAASVFPAVAGSPGLAILRFAPLSLPKTLLSVAFATCCVRDASELPPGLSP